MKGRGEAADTSKGRQRRKARGRGEIRFPPQVLIGPKLVAFYMAAISNSYSQSG